MLKYENVRMIEVDDLDNLVKETYGRPYNFQQQAGCLNRGVYPVTVPDDDAEDFEDSAQEDLDCKLMGVSFKTWLARDPAQNIHEEKEWATTLWWERNFYPRLEVVLNDLHEKGLVEAGDYCINVDW